MKIITASSIYPVSASYIADDNIEFNGDNELFVTNDGYSLFKSDVITNFKDISSNKNTVIGLSTKQTTTDLIHDTSITIGTKGPLAISPSNNVSSIYGIDDQYEMIVVSLYSPEAVLWSFRHFETINGEKFYTIYYRDQVISLDTNYKMYIDSFSNLDTQVFKLQVLSPDMFRFISRNGIIAIEPNGADFHLHLFDSEGNKVNPYSLTTDMDGYNTINKWVQYDKFYQPEYNDSPSLLTVDENDSIDNILTNFILYAPFNSIEISGDYATIPLNIIPTKNFKTIGNELSLIPEVGIAGADLVDFREYNRIYTGGNQTEGYSNISLGYSSIYSDIILFKPDQYTYFHLPKTAQSLNIQNAGFDFAGATGGAVPKFTDRIYKKLANYENMIWWGGGSHHDKQNGTWLCAWLSGSDTSQDNIWMERYFDPGQITSEDALTIDNIEVNAGFDYIPNGNPVQDVISTMTMEPGAYYKYYHIGSDGFEDMLTSFKGISDSDMSIQLSDFTTGDIINDDSFNNNDAMVYGIDNADQVTMDIGFGSETQSALLLNSNAELRVNSSPSLNNPNDRTINTWSYFRDWNDSISTTIFSNYYRGGDKLEYINHGTYYSYIIPSYSGLVGSELFKVIPADISEESQIIDIPDIEGIPVTIAVDLDGFMWVGVYNALEQWSKLFKLSSSGVLIDLITLDGYEILQFIIKDDNIGYVTTKSVTSATAEIYSVQLHTMEATYDSVLPTNSIIYIDNSGTLNIVDNALDVDNDNAGGIFWISSNGEYIYHNGSRIILSEHETYESICSDGKYVVITAKNIRSKYIKLYKINIEDADDISINTIYLGYDINKNPLNVAFMTKEPSTKGNDITVYWVGYNTIKKYTTNIKNEFVEEINLNLTTPTLGSIMGDFSGYKLNKIDRILNNSESYIKYSSILMKTMDNSKLRKSTIRVNTSSFLDNWKMVSITQDIDNNRIRLYIDGYFDKETQILGEVTYYFKGAMLNIGGAVEGSVSLFEKLGLQNRNINGAISEFNIYSKRFDETDIRNLYMSKFSGSTEMSWVLNNGNKFFVEELQHIFKFKKPGIKSQFFNIVIKNFSIPVSDRVLYEQTIIDNITGIVPVNMKLLKIIWR